MTIVGGAIAPVLMGYIADTTGSMAVAFLIPLLCYAVIGGYAATRRRWIKTRVNFKDIIGIEKYSSVFYGAKVDGAVDRNNSEGRGGAIPSLGEIRNCHINVGTGKELTIREHSELVVKAVGFEGEVEFDASKPTGTMRRLISVDKLHSLGWTHKVEIEDGVKKLFDWYQKSLCKTINKY